MIINVNLRHTKAYEPKPCIPPRVHSLTSPSARCVSKSPAKHPLASCIPYYYLGGRVNTLSPLRLETAGRVGRKVASPRTILLSCLDPSSPALAATEGLATMHEIDIAIMEPRALQIDNTGSDVDSVSGYPSLPFATAQPGQNNGSLIHVCISVWPGGD